MAITTIDDKHLSNIATAIRQKRGIEDTFKPSEMAEAIKDISGGEPILEEVVVQPKTVEQIITPSEEYDGLSQVKIGAVTRLIDGSIQPENIKKDVEILGVIGTIEDKPADPVLQSKIVEPSIGKQTITFDSGYDGLRQVIINEVTNKIDSNIKSDNIKQGVSILGVQGTLEPGAEVVKKYRPRHISFYASEATDLDNEIAMLDTSLVEHMTYMFNYCNQITRLDLSSFDTSNVKGSLEKMFAQCTKLTELNLSNFNTSQITSMYYMFESCKFRELDLSSFDTSNVTNFSYMFRTCGDLEKLNVSSFNTTSATNMAYMFHYCKSLKELDLSNFVTSSVTSMSYMFEYCSSLKKLDIRNFTFEKVNKSYTGMLNYVPTDCLIIVKDDERKQWLSSKFSSRANYIKTVAEYQAEGGV